MNRSTPPSPAARRRRTAALVTRTLVSLDDPGFTKPTKPIGRFVPAEEAAMMVEHGEPWEDRGEKGWRRMVASPEPKEILDAPAVLALIDAGFVVVAAAAAGSPSSARPTARCAASRPSSTRTSGRRCSADARHRGARDRHRRAARRAPLGTPEAEDIGRVQVSQMEAYVADGHFASGSMGPKVEAACRFAVSRSRRPEPSESMQRWEIVNRSGEVQDAGKEHTSSSALTTSSGWQRDQDYDVVLFALPALRTFPEPVPTGPGAACTTCFAPRPLLPRGC